MLEFAQDELILPKGPYSGRPFRADRQPYTRPFLEAMNDPRWNTVVITGPAQAGKTWIGLVIPVLYHLFELRETVILGGPDMDLLADKWREDLLPSIESSRFRDLLPRLGGGSRGGKVDTIQFAHGPCLKMMSAGGSDKSRAAYTSRVVCITETDGMRGASTSEEADPITQIQARMRAYPARRRRCYMECTVSTERGRTWHEYTNGTQTRLLIRCPHCRGWVLPEREHLRGWQNAEDERAAAEAAHFVCPACEHSWSEQDRRAAHESMKLVHRGQHLDSEGNICGGPPDTHVLGLRFSAVHNFFLTAGDLGVDEWRAARSSDEVASLRNLCQFVWCIPTPAPDASTIPERIDRIIARSSDEPRGIAPIGTSWITVGIDCGKYLLHWVVLASRPDASATVIDYGRTPVASVDLGVELGLLTALRELTEQLAPGWPIRNDDGSLSALHPPDAIWCDSNWMPPVVYQFARERGVPFLPTHGRGATQGRRNYYQRPGSGSSVMHIGDGYHVVYVPAENVHRVDFDADAWKTRLAARLETPEGQPGAILLFRASPSEHVQFARQLCAEEMVEQFVAGRGLVQRWESRSPANHWLDATVLACIAASMCGATPTAARTASMPPVKPQPASRPGTTAIRSGRTFGVFSTRRWRI